MVQLPPGSLSPTMGTIAPPIAGLPMRCHLPSSCKLGGQQPFPDILEMMGTTLPRSLVAGWILDLLPILGVPRVSELARGCLGAGSASLPELLKVCFYSRCGNTPGTGTHIPPSALIPTLKDPSQLLPPP